MTLNTGTCRSIELEEPTIGPLQRLQGPWVRGVRTETVNIIGLSRILSPFRGGFTWTAPTPHVNSEPCTL